MANCERLESCPFFNDRMASMPSIASIYKKQYCLGEPARCARLIVLKAKGADAVPIDLFPNQTEKAKALLEP
jgi:hypothetical protein